MTRSTFRRSPRVNWFLLNQARKRRHSTPRIPQHLKDLVQAYWTMNEETGTRLDSSGHLIHLNQYRGPVGNQSGQLGLAARFIDDINASTMLGNQDPGVNQGYLILDNADLTLNVWINRLANQDMFICGRFNPVPNPQAYDYFLKISDAGDLHFQVKTGDGASVSHDDIVTCSAPAIGQWHMVTAIVDQNGLGNLRLYVDSVLQNSAPMSDFTTAGSPGGVNVDFTVGCAGTSTDPTLPFRGGIDELGNWCFNVLTQADINTLWNGGLGCTW